MLMNQMDAIVMEEPAKGTREQQGKPKGKAVKAELRATVQHANNSKNHILEPNPGLQEENFEEAMLKIPMGSMRGTVKADNGNSIITLKPDLVITRPWRSLPWSS